MTSIKFRLPIKDAYDLTELINALNLVRRLVPNTGPYSFERRWRHLKPSQRVAALSAIREITNALGRLCLAKVIVDGEIEGETEE